MDQVPPEAPADYECAGTSGFEFSATLVVTVLAAWLAWTQLA